MLRKVPADIQALATTPLFRNLSRRELAALARIGTVVELGPRRLVSRPGEHPAQFVVIVRGRVVATTALGPRRVLREGNWLGTVDECGGEAEESESFRTVITTTLYVLSARELGALQDACPRFAARLSGLTDRPPKVERVAGAWVGALRTPGGAATTGRATSHVLRSTRPAASGTHERTRDGRVRDGRVGDVFARDGGATEGSAAEGWDRDVRLVRPARRSYT
jgi:CRP-like cAMP-binding protein